MGKHKKIIFTPKEFTLIHLMMKQKYDELLTFGYDEEMDVEEWKTFNRAFKKLNMKADEAIHAARQLEGNGEVYDYES